MHGREAISRGSWPTDSRVNGTTLFAKPVHKFHVRPNNNRLACSSGHNSICAVNTFACARHIPAYRHIGIPNFTFFSSKITNTPGYRVLSAGWHIVDDVCTIQISYESFLSLHFRRTTATVNKKKKSTQNRLEFMSHCVPFYQCRGFCFSTFFFSPGFPFLFRVASRYSTALLNSPNDI